MSNYIDTNKAIVAGLIATGSYFGLAWTLGKGIGGMSYVPTSVSTNKDLQEAIGLFIVAYAAQYAADML